MAEQIRFPRGVTKDHFLDAVRAGVHDSMRELMSTGTSTPGAAFYGAVRDGVEAAMKAVAREREVTTGGTRQEPEPSASVAEKGPEP